MRAPRRADYGRRRCHGRTAPARGHSQLPYGRGATCQLRPATPNQRQRTEVAQGACCLLGRRSTRNLPTQAPRCVGYGRRRSCGSMPHCREAKLVRRTAMVRRASCGLQRRTDNYVFRAARLLVAVGPRLIRGHQTGERPLIFGARPWCDLLAMTTDAKPAAACQASSGGPALAVSWEEAQHTSLLRARAALCWLLWSAHHEGRRTDERPLSYGAQPWCDVPTTATNARPVAACQASAGAPALELSLGSSRSIQAR